MQRDQAVAAIRLRTFMLSAQELAVPKGSDSVYAVVIDWNKGLGVETIIAKKGGEVSVLFSPGGGVIDRGKHENVRNAVEVLLTLSQNYGENFTSSKSQTLPTARRVKFLLLTGHGWLSSEASMEELENTASPLYPLFEQAKRLEVEVGNTLEK